MDRMVHMWKGVMECLGCLRHALTDVVETLEKMMSQSFSGHSALMPERTT
jgi:hypothetical protein